MRSSRSESMLPQDLAGEKSSESQSEAENLQVYFRLSDISKIPKNSLLKYITQHLLDFNHAQGGYFLFDLDTAISEYARDEKNKIILVEITVPAELQDIIQKKIEDQQSYHPVLCDNQIVLPFDDEVRKLFNPDYISGYWSATRTKEFLLQAKFCSIDYLKEAAAEMTALKIPLETSIWAQPSHQNQKEANQKLVTASRCHIL